MTITADTESATLVDMASASEGGVPLPRFSLRKRKATTTECAPSVCLPSVDSAFLGGLFADVAEIQRSDESSSALVDPSSVVAEAPSKKSRSSLTRAISRCPKSYKSLFDAIFPSCGNLSSPQAPPSSPDDLTRQVSPETSPSTRTKLLPYSKVMGSCARLPDFSSDIQESPSFPHLPPAVSVSSCNSTVTRSNSDLPSSVTETGDKECYGWFIEMDDLTEKVTVDAYHRNSISNDSAFVAPTASEAVNHDAEVEWAKAADTVDSVLDDVLGDFF